MSDLVKIRCVKSFRENGKTVKVGDVVEMSPKRADAHVKAKIAEYVDEAAKPAKPKA